MRQSDRHQEGPCRPAPALPHLILATAFSLSLACGQGTASRQAGAGEAGTADRPGAGATNRSAGHRPAPPDACLLLPPADVEAVTSDVAGSLSSTLEDAVGRDPSQCAYPLASAAQPRMISLTVRREADTEVAAGRQQDAAAGLRSLGAGTPVEAVPLVGEGDAIWVGGQLDQLHFRSGDTLLVLTVQIDRQPLATARSLAARILARLNAPAPPAAPVSPGLPTSSATPSSPAAPTSPGGRSR
jgi:hypothetical protein